MGHSYEVLIINNRVLSSHRLFNSSSLGQQATTMWGILKYIPKNHLSYVVGKLVAMRLPYPLSLLSIHILAWLYKIDTSEAAKPLKDYASIAEFFTRDLKDNLRTFDEGLCSPVDGRLRSYGEIKNGTLPQIKGKQYSLVKFLGDPKVAASYEGGTFFNLYLSPQDYHQIHFPCSGKVSAATYIPGKLWPVNDWSIRTIDDLFSENERIVTYIDSEIGVIALVMVGATNVGKMTVVYENWITNNLKTSSADFKTYARPMNFQKGDKLGVFHMGSSVVLLVPRQTTEPLSLSSIEQGAKVKLGQRLTLTY